MNWFMEKSTARLSQLSPPQNHRFPVTFPLIKPILGVYTVIYCAFSSLSLSHRWVDKGAVLLRLGGTHSELYRTHQEPHICIALCSADRFLRGLRSCTRETPQVGGSNPSGRDHELDSRHVECRTAAAASWIPAQWCPQRASLLPSRWPMARIHENWLQRHGARHSFQRTSSFQIHSTEHHGTCAKPSAAFLGME